MSVTPTTMRATDIKRLADRLVASARSNLVELQRALAEAGFSPR